MEQKWLAAIGFCFLLILGVLGHEWYFNMEPKRMYSDAVGKNQNGDYQGAVELLNQVLNRTSDVHLKAWSYLSRAASYHALNQTKKAASDLEAAITLDSIDYRGYISRAQLSCDARNYAAMESDYRRVNYAYLNYGALLDLARLDYNRGDYRSAVNDSSNAISSRDHACESAIRGASRGYSGSNTSVCDKGKEAFYLRGMAHYKLGEMPAAAEDIVQAEKLSGGLLTSQDMPNFAYNLQAKLEYLQSRTPFVIECQ